MLRRALLFLIDLAIVCFSFYLGLLLRADGAPDVDITSTQNGYSVCLVFGARRIKYIKTIRNQSEETHMIKFLVLSQNF